MRQQAAESTTTLNILGAHDRDPRASASNSVPSTPVTRPRRCSRCGSLRPANAEDDGSDEEVVHEGEGREKAEDASPPPSPATFIESPGFAPSPWASTATLLSSAFSMHKPGQSVKRKDSVGLRKLFMKGKEKERERERGRVMERRGEKEKGDVEYDDDEPRSPIPNDDLQSWEEITPSEAEVDAPSKSPRKKGVLDSQPQRPSPSQTRSAPIIAPPPRPPRFTRRNAQVTPFDLPPPSLSDIPFPPEKVPLPPHLAPSIPNRQPAPSPRRPRETHLSSPTPLRAPGPRPPRDRSPLISRFRRPELDAPYPAARMSIEPSASVATGGSGSSSGSSITQIAGQETRVEGSTEQLVGTNLVTEAVATNSCAQMGGDLEEPSTVSGAASTLALPPLRTLDVSTALIHDSSPVSPASPTFSTPYSTPQTAIQALPARAATPTTPTTPTGHHYVGRPLPRPPTTSHPNSPAVITRPMTPNRAPQGGGDLRDDAVRHSPERAASLGSLAVPRDVQLRPEWSNYTDLDVFVARLDVGGQPNDGRNYEVRVALLH